VTVIVEKLAVIGVGLIGGSFALALKEAGAVNFVAGFGRTKENLQDALAFGVIDDAYTEIEEAVEDADVIMLAVPVRAMAELVKDMAPFLKNGAIITDAGSTKEVILGELFAFLPSHAHIVAGHPIAGSEQTGAAAAEPDLYKDKRVIITPDKTSEDHAIEVVKKLWEACGAKVEMMDPSTHDIVLGAVSHLPHMVAYALVDTLMKWDDEVPMLRFSAGGLRDFTRIASSSPEMWRDICVDNEHVIVEALDRYIESLKKLRDEIKSGDDNKLLERFKAARKVRSRIMKGDPD
jgi:prephenate dehydrogenase